MGATGCSKFNVSPSPQNLQIASNHHIYKSHTYRIQHKKAYLSTVPINTPKPPVCGPSPAFWTDRAAPRHRPRRPPHGPKGPALVPRPSRPETTSGEEESPLEATSSKCIATRNKCLTSSNKKLLGTSASLLGTSALCLHYGRRRVYPLVEASPSDGHSILDIFAMMAEDSTLDPLWIHCHPLR